MANVTTPTMTAEEFLTWANRPENADRRFELDRGRVVEVPPPFKLHGLVTWLVIRILTAYLSRRGTGYLLTNDTGILVERNPDTLRGADVMLFLSPVRENDFAPGTYVEGAPDLIVEVLSPGDRPNRVSQRVGQYLRHGVPLVWLIDPEDRTVNVYRPDEYPKLLDETDDLTGNGVLPDFACKVADLFTLPGQPPPARS